MSVLDALDEVLDGLRAVGRWNVYEASPASIQTPAVFPGAVDRMERSAQSGERAAVWSFYVARQAGEADAQRALYEDVEAVWEALELVSASVVLADQFGVLSVADTDYLGARLEVEVFC